MSQGTLAWFPCRKIVSFYLQEQSKNTNKRELFKWFVCNIPRKPLNENSIMPLEGYYEPMSKEKVSKFSLVGKHLLWETNFPFDIGSKKDL